MEGERREGGRKGEGGDGGRKGEGGGFDIWTINVSSYLRKMFLGGRILISLNKRCTLVRYSFTELGVIS